MIHTKTKASIKGKIILIFYMKVYIDQNYSQRKDELKMSQKLAYLLAGLLFTIGIFYYFSQESPKNHESKTTSSDLFDPEIKNNTLAVGPKEDIVIVGKSDSPDILIYDLKTKKKIKKLSGFLSPRNIAFSKDSSSFFVSDSSLGSIQEFDVMTFERIANYPMEKGVFGFALTKDGKKIIANNQAENSVTILDINTKKQETISGFSGPRQGILIDSTDSYAYVTNFQSDDVKVLDLKTKQIVNTLKNIPKVRAISLDEKNNLLYGASSSNNSINVVDSATGDLLHQISVGEEPYGCILLLDKNLILTGDKGSNQVSVIDLATNKVIRTIKGLKAPRQAIAISQTDDQAYVLNEDLSVSLIDYQKGTILETIGA